MKTGEYLWYYERREKNEDEFCVCASALHDSLVRNISRNWSGKNSRLRGESRLIATTAKMRSKHHVFSKLHIHAVSLSIMTHGMYIQ